MSQITQVVGTEKCSRDPGRTSNPIQLLPVIADEVIELILQDLVDALVLHGDLLFMLTEDKSTSRSRKLMEDPGC